MSVVALHDRRDNDSSFTVLIHDQTLNDAQLVDTVIMPRISEAVSRISSSLTAPRKSPREHNESPQSLFEEVQRNAVNLYSVLDIGTFILEQQCGSSAFATICLLTDGISCTAEAFHRPTRAIQRFLAMNGLLSIVMHRPLAHGPADEGFGIVPAEEHIKFVVSALGGNLSDTRDVGRHARVTRNPDPVSTAALNEATVNFFHNLLLLRFIPLVVDARPRRMLDPGSTLDVYVNMLSPLSSCWNHKGQLSVQIRDLRLNDVDLWTVLKTRLRQGFVLRSLQPRGNGGSIGSGRAASMRSQAKLVYHWHPSILIEYKIRSTAPIMWSFSATALTPMTDGATTTNSSSDIVADSGCRVEVSVRCSHEFANYLIVLMKYANVSSQTTPALTWLYEAKGRALMAFLAELNASDEALSALNSALTSADAVFHVPSALVLTPDGQALCFSDADLDTTSAMDGVFRHYWATLSEAMRKQHAAELAAIDSWSTEILLVHEDVDTAFDDLAHYFHLHWSTFALNRFECVRLNPNGPGYVVAALRRLTPHLVEIRASAVHLGVSQRQEEWVRFSYMLQNAAQRADVAYRPLAKSLSPLLPDEILSGERGIVEVPSRSRNLDYMRTISRSWKIHDRALARDIYRALVKRHQHQGFLPIFQIKDMASHSVQLLDNGRRYTLSQVEINDDCIITVTFSVEADWSMYSVFDMLHEDEIYVCAQVTFQRLLGLMEETGTEDTASLHAIEQDLVDVSALLPFSRVDTNMYELPSVSHMDYPRSTPAFQPPPNAKLHTLSTGDLLQDSNFTSSHPQLTEDLLAWYFMENELSYYAAVEFDLSSARTCAAFFRQFDMANAMSLDVAEYRCFVVSASAHKLTLVFVPSLVKELARVDFQQECVSVRNIPIYTAHCDVVGMRKRFMQNDKNAMSVLHSEAVDQAIRLLIARAHAQNHYGRLLRGHAVGELALDKDCFRDESIEIDLTPFLNTLVNVTLRYEKNREGFLRRWFSEC